MFSLLSLKSRRNEFTGIMGLVSGIGLSVVLANQPNLSVWVLVLSSFVWILFALQVFWLLDPAGVKEEVITDGRSTVSENTVTDSRSDLVGVLMQWLIDAKNDSNRVNELISESTSTLHTSFDQLLNHYRKHRDPDQAKDDLTECVNEAIIALQFEDISVQLLGQLTQRLEELVPLVRALHPHDKSQVDLDLVRQHAPVSHEKVFDDSVELF